MVVYLGNPEVEDLCLASRGDENVRRFQIAMHNAFRVRGFESINNLHAEGE